MGKNARRPRATAKPRLRSPRGIALVIGVLAVGVFAGGGWILAQGGDGENEAVSATDRTAGASATLIAAPALVAGVELAQPLADRGRIPLNTPVRQEWRLRNTGPTAVTLGKPAIQVLEGC